ncbi:MAG TPA: hypothetical protein VEO54_26535 [Thermoanaerobaculia bacterium]|nr:hypothetical protein [Thermoanaerobaculia bacterium]
METTKKPALAALVRVLDSANVSYAIIGGVAVQVHHPDPRTTLDIEVAVLSADAIPRDALIAAGFKSTGSFEHSENWVAENGTPVQFTDDPDLASAVRSAEEISLENVTLRVIRVLDLVRQKLRAGSDPARVAPNGFPISWTRKGCSRTIRVFAPSSRRRSSWCSIGCLFEPRFRAR